MENAKIYVSRIVLLLVLTVIITLFLASLALSKRDANVYPSNVSISGIELDGMTWEQAADILTNKLPARYGDELLLRISERSFAVPFDQVGLALDVPATLDKLDASLQPEGIPGIFQHSIARGSSRDFPPEFKWDQNLLEDELIMIKLLNDQPAVNAKILYSDDYLKYISHKNGYAVDIEASLESIEGALQRGSLGPIALITKETYPWVELEDIKDVKDLLGVCSGRVNPAADDLAALLDICNGSIVMREEEYSLLNEVELTSFNIDASTLSVLNKSLTQACAQAGLKLLENDGFVNNLEHPVLITATLEGDSLVVQIFGCQTEEGKKISFVTETENLFAGIKVQENSQLLPEQKIVLQQGHDGYINRKYRIVKDGGEEIEKTLLSEEYVPATDTIIAVGSGGMNK